MSSCVREPQNRIQPLPRPGGPARQTSAQPGRAGASMDDDSACPGVPWERRRRGTLCFCYDLMLPSEICRSHSPLLRLRFFLHACRVPPAKKTFPRVRKLSKSAYIQVCPPITSCPSKPFVDRMRESFVEPGQIHRRFGLTTHTTHITHLFRRPRSRILGDDISPKF